ncbi:MAG: tRNA preQ1(34) S-adenosylmethionine ribosyltransferase-isomerase QueA [Elusimicrobia bacterium]|nr:tRNA preQ1(34) S-adenosylmethionine ribosyltransferase-isomerase QueA [Elusimicrobiota bacterium]MDE2424867.1 tRNA preQ1(34) S-adenosylmethionine ribosyltransferase-isomerase QueA [Elusimicrobiota bacterium]
MPLSDYDFFYPEELVACEAAEPRDSARLLLADRASGSIEHRIFRDLPELLDPGDCVVLNVTRVLACRLLGKKSTGGKADLLLVRQLSPGLWSALASGLKIGAALEFPGGLTARVEGLDEEGEYQLRFSSDDIPAYLEERGLAPLPPYIAKRRPPRPFDRRRYQTVYAARDGSIAAPTAGLHFTDDLLAALSRRGVRLASLTLHVGRGTFRPILAQDAAQHRMLPEFYELKSAEAAKIEAARSEGRRVVAVGTTSTRALETLGGRPEGFGPGSGWTSLYIAPGHRFRIVSSLVTNFHLPRSTPLLLASAFLGRERLLAAYREAVRLRYRLYSFGDAMLIR